MKYNHIDILLKQKNLQQKDLIHFVKMSRQGFYSMVEKRSMKVDVLEKMSDFFNVPISYWFEEEKTNQAILKEPGVNYKSNENFIEMKEQLKFMRELFKEVKEENKKLKEEISSCKESDYHQSKRAM